MKDRTTSSLRTVLCRAFSCSRLTNSVFLPVVVFIIPVYAGSYKFRSSDCIMSFFGRTRCGYPSRGMVLHFNGKPELWSWFASCFLFVFQVVLVYSLLIWDMLTLTNGVLDACRLRTRGCTTVQTRVRSLLRPQVFESEYGFSTSSLINQHY